MSTDLTQHVPTRATCERLRDAGFPQDTYLHWRQNAPTYGWDLVHWEPKVPRRQLAAPIASELLEVLRPADSGTWIDLTQWHDGVAVARSRAAEPCTMRADEAWTKRASHANPAEALALLWLALHEEAKRDA